MTTEAAENTSLQRMWAIAAITLIAGTNRLWFENTFPRVSMLGSSSAFACSLVVIGALAVVLAALIITVNPSQRRKFWWLLTGGFILTFLGDQHCLQPWAYQLAIFGAVFASLPTQATTQRLLIPFIASVYLYSGLSKLDFQFMHTVGQDFLTAIARPIGGLPDELAMPWRAKLAMVFPAVELIASIGILIPRTRRVAGFLLMAMHAGLIAILGPWSLDHSTGVLLWNIALTVQAWLLFAKKPLANPSISGEGYLVPLHLWILIAAFMLAPITERFGYWDHWPSWALYAPHTSRADIEIHRTAIESIDPQVRSHLVEGDDGWHRLSTSGWSLAARGVPVYPQGRFQLKLASLLAQKHELDSEIRVRLRGVADRWTGQRETQLMIGGDQIEAGLEQFWLH